MFAVLRRKSIIFFLVFAAAIALGCVMLVMSPAAHASVPKLGRTVVLDAGHGGIDGGVVGPGTGVTEAEINLGIVRSLRHLLVKSGYDVVLTRDSGDGLYDSKAQNLKRSDMTRRKETIEAARPDLVVSVHQNYYPLSSVRGAQVFYDGESESGKEFALSAQKTLNSALGGDREAKPGDYYMVKCTPYPSVIVECGFLSNAEEERLLVTAAYQEKVAYALFSAIHAELGGS